jgi:bacillolysin
MKLNQILALLIMLIPYYAKAQTKFRFSQKEFNEHGNIRFALLDKQEQKIATQENKKDLLNTICIDPNISFQFERSYGDNLNFTHEVYQLYYYSIKVISASYVIHSQNNALQYVNGVYPVLKNIDTKARIDWGAAKEKAKNYFQSETNTPLSVQVKNMELVICQDYLQKSSNYRLAYQFKVQTTSESDAVLIFVDALNGAIISKEEMICNFNGKQPPNALGAGQLGYTVGNGLGFTQFTTDAIGNQYRLREVRNGVNILTLNANYQYNGDAIVNSATDFIDNDNNWYASEHGANRSALDAHWGAEKVLDYWKTVHNRNSINNAGMPIVSFIHVTDAVISTHPNLDGAYWDNNRNAMFYGDGFVKFRPAPCLDVCGHEIGHGICQYTSNLSGAANSEARALNEGFSDIWGASIEAWVDPNRQRWLIAEEITIAAPYFLRSLSNPKSVTNDPSPDCYGGQYWASKPNLYYRCGVLNKWYFLLTEGGTSTNDLGNFYDLTGIGITAASKIAYRTEILLSSGSSYVDARTMSIQATRDIYGLNSCQEIAVIKAWYAVGVGVNYGGVVPQINTSITGPDLFCTNATYNINNVPAGSSGITWSSSNNSIATVVGNGLSATVTRVSNGGFTLTALFTLPPSLCNGTKTIIKNIEIGNPTNVPITTQPSSNLCIGSNFTATTTITNGTGYTWVAPTGATITSGQGTNTVTLQISSTPLQNSLNVQVSTLCGNTYGNLYLNAGPQFPFPGINQPYITLLNSQCLSNTATASVIAVPGATSYVWRVREFDINNNQLFNSGPIITTTNVATASAGSWPNLAYAVVTVYAISNCGQTETKSATFNTCKLTRVALENITATPNPTQGLININIPNNFINKSSYELHNSSGNSIISGKLVNLKRNLTIDLTSQNAGIYILYLKNDKNEQKQIKIIKE